MRQRLQLILPRSREFIAEDEIEQQTCLQFADLLVQVGGEILPKRSDRLLACGVGSVGTLGTLDRLDVQFAKLPWIDR